MITDADSAATRHGPPTDDGSTVPLVEMVLRRDARGTLSAGELGTHFPFGVERYFVISGVVPGAPRGDHAHRTLHQFVVCLSGSCAIAVDDGRSRRSITLSSQATGLYAPPLTWLKLSDFTPDAVVLVLASAVYDADDYIHDYEEFTRLAAPTRSSP